MGIQLDTLISLELGKLTMDRTPDAFERALASGDTDAVNDAIDAVDDMDAVDLAAMYDDCFDRCLHVYEGGGGYQRQSVVRFLRDAYPNLELKQVGGGGLPDDVAPEEVDAQRERLVEFLLAALEDDDGRIRKAAAKGLELQATTMRMCEYDAEFEALEELLIDLERDLPKENRKHAEQVRHHLDRQRGLGLF